MQREDGVEEGGADAEKQLSVPSVPLVASVDETAHLLGIGRTTLYQLMMSGALKSFKVGKRRLVSRASIDEYVKQKTSEV